MGEERLKEEGGKDEEIRQGKEEVRDGVWGGERDGL